MGDRVVARVHQGRLAAVKIARDVAEADRLDREAAVLAAVSHPGVVHLLDHVPGVELVTAHVGDHHLGDAPPVGLRAGAARVAATAALVAELHVGGLVHGAVEPSHVLLTGDGRPVLCSLHLAGPPGSPFPEDTADPAFPAGEPRHPAADVHGLGTLLAHVLEREASPPLSDVRLRRALERAARAASHTHPARRPSAVALAATLARLAGQPAPERASGPTVTADAEAAPSEFEAAAEPARRSLPRRPGSPRPNRPHLGARNRADVRPVGTGEDRARRSGAVRARATAGRVPTPLLAAAAVAASAAAVLLLGSGGTPEAVAPAPTVAPAAEPSATPPPPTTQPPANPAPTTQAPTTTVPPTATAVPATTSGGGGDEAPAVPEIVAGGQRYAVGRSGDRIAVGDWDCDGQATVALLRPSTGAVFVFGSWAPEGGTLEGTAVTHRPGATDVRTVAGPDGCDGLELVAPDGSNLLTLPPAAEDAAAGPAVGTS